MNGNATLAQLRDIHLPPPVGWWPPPPGWWLVLLLLLAALALAGWFLLRYRRNSYRRAALRELRSLRDNPGDLADRARLELLAALVRRVAIQSCGREQVAPLSGPAWLAFLDRSGRTAQFTGGVGQALGLALYQADSAVDLAGLFPLVENWIGNHRTC